jgi:hypothetical protein
LIMWSPLLSQTRPRDHLYEVKPAHVISSIKQSPVLKGHICISLL